MSIAAPSAAVSVDLDSLWCYREIHGLPPHAGGSADIDAAYSVGVRRLLGLFDEVGIPATLFAIGRDVERPAHATILREAARSGHEIASHSFAHDYALRNGAIWEIRDDLRRAHDVIHEAVGEEPVGFRTPGYNVDARILGICAELGYFYDSSVFPCPPYWFAKAGVMAWLAARGRPSRSSMTRIDTLLAPLTPYRPHSVQFWRADEDSALPYEVPMCVVPGVRYPVIGTSLHLLGRKGIAWLAPLLERTHPDLLNLEFHAIDFMDDSDPGTEELRGLQPDLEIPWLEKRDLYVDFFHRLADYYRFETLADAVQRHTGEAPRRRSTRR